MRATVYNPFRSSIPETGLTLFMGVLAMFVAFTKDVPGSDIKAKDIREVPDSIGRAYVDSDYGKETDAMTVLRAEQMVKYAELETSLTKAITAAVKPQKPSPPSYSRSLPDGSLAIERDTEIRGGEASAERDPRGRSDKGPTPGDLTRMMYWAKVPLEDEPRITEGMQLYARKRLRHWQERKLAEQTEWIDHSMDRVTEDNPGGVARDASESTQGAATYGYLVRPEFAGDVFRIQSETDVFTGLRKIPMGRAVELRYPALDQYSTTTPTRTSNLFGGVTLYRKPEDGARTEVDAKISEIIFKLTDLTGMTKVSRDLLADSFIDLNGYLQDLFREAFGWRRDWDFFNGIGVGEPQGILGATSTINGGGVSGNTTRVTSGHIRYEDLAWMISVIWPTARQGMYWIVNAQAARELQAIQATSPSGFVYQPNTMISQAMLPSIYSGSTWDGILMGFPVKLTEKAPALNTTGDISLFAPRYYGEAQREGVEIGLTEHRYWEFDQIGIRWKLRNDGQPMLKNKIVGADGNTYSTCATLVHL